VVSGLGGLWVTRIGAPNVPLAVRAIAGRTPEHDVVHTVPLECLRLNAVVGVGGAGSLDGGGLGLGVCVGAHDVGFSLVGSGSAGRDVLNV